MQIRIFTIPILGGEVLQEEMNAFLRSKKVLHVEPTPMQDGGGAFWSFCVKYLDQPVKRKKEKVDYKSVLDEKSFERFSKMRSIRRQISRERGIPAYGVFYDVELAELAKIEHLTPEAMLKVKGIGKKRVEEYGSYFISSKDKTHETSESSGGTHS